jgi:large conductance mechanosensitive channel
MSGAISILSGEMLKEFRNFILRGNVVDLAVGVVIGAAFTAVVNGLVSSFLTPLIALLGGKDSFVDLSFRIAGTEFPYGQFLDALLTFLIVAAVVFFLVVKPVNELLERLRPEPPTAAPELRDCPECLSSIPAAAKRCMHCTAEVQPSAT